MMRLQIRNTEKVYVADYSGKTARTDTNGHKDGTYDVTYGNASAYDATVSSAKGSAELAAFGINTRYSKSILFSGKAPFKEDAAIWLDFGIIPDFSSSNAYLSGAIVKYSGAIYRAKTNIVAGAWNASNWSSVPHNYYVTKIAPSPTKGYTLIAVSEVE